MPGEFILPCGCKITDLERQGDEIVFTVRCEVRREEASEAPGEAAAGGEAQEQRVIKAPVTKILR